MLINWLLYKSMNIIMPPLAVINHFTIQPSGYIIMHESGIIKVSDDLYGQMLVF